MEIFAHRGLSGLYPENTMLSFAKAYEKKTYGIELDIQFTKDNQIVILHDENLKRTTGMNEMVTNVEFSDVKKLNATLTKPDCENQHIPTLQEYLEWVKDKNIVTNIEIKSSVVYYHGLEQSAVDMIKDYGLSDRIIFSSFNPLSLILIKKTDKKLKCGLLVENQLINAGKCCSDFGFEYYHPCIEGLSKEIIEECHSCNVGVNVWTVNKKEELDKLCALGADGAFCNYLF